MTKELFIEITNRCNLKCRHCYFKEQRSEKEMSPENFEKIICMADSLDYVVVSGGEPFAHSQIGHILEICVSHPEIPFIFTTNGTIEADVLCQSYAKAKNIHVNLSLDGSTPEINDRIRGKGTYQMVDSLAKRLSSIDSSRLKLRMTITRWNYSDIADFFSYALSLGTVPEYMFVAKCGAAAENWDELNPTISNKLYCFTTIKKFYSEHHISGAKPPSEVLGCTGCSWSINSEGNIYSCSYFPDYHFANIFTDSLEEIERKNLDNDLTRRIEKWKSSLRENECVSCAIKNHCRQGCYAKHLFHSENNTDNTDGYCNFRKARFVIANADRTIIRSKKNDCF